MLMGLIGRGKESPIEEGFPVVDAEAYVEPTPVVIATPTKAAEPEKKAPKRSMRSSDIKDEHGRSAEEIAAEAAQEFDIAGLVSRVSNMPDRPDAEVKRPGQPAKSKETDAPAAPIVHVVQQAAPETTPEPVQEEVLPFADGHIAMPRGEAQSRQSTRIARQKYWATVGQVEKQRISLPKSPDGANASGWPSGQAVFRIVRTEDSLIIASDGLSDPFTTSELRPEENGLGMEVFIEVAGWQAVPNEDISKSWAFKAIVAFAQVSAKSGGITPCLKKHGLMSMALPLEQGPDGWFDDDPDASLGGLINMPLPRERCEMQDMPLSPVQVVPLTLLHAVELDECIMEGADERRALADDLLTTGTGHRTIPSRTSLR